MWYSFIPEVSASTASEESCPLVLPVSGFGNTVTKAAELLPLPLLVLLAEEEAEEEAGEEAGEEAEVDEEGLEFVSSIILPREGFAVAVVGLVLKTSNRVEGEFGALIGFGRVLLNGETAEASTKYFSSSSVSSSSWARISGGKSLSSLNREELDVWLLGLSFELSISEAQVSS